MAEVSKLDITSYTKFLPLQYNNSPDLIKLLSVFLEEVQELEDANMDLDKFSTDVLVAFGYQLDIIGKIVGVQRKGMSDEQYREAIYFQISINVGQGTPEDAIQYLSYVTKATNINYWEHYPASVILETNGTNIPSNIPNTLDNITPAGVAVGGVIASETGLVFRGCDTDTAYDNYIEITGTGSMGVGDEDAENGSPLAELYSDGYKGFLDVSEFSPQARCIFPDLSQLQTPTYNGAGEEVMASGEIYAEASDLTEDVSTTLGVFADVYTKI